MASWKDLIMADGETLFTAKAPKDPMPGRREKLLAAIDGAISEPKRGWVSVKQGIAKVSLRIGSKVVPIDGQDAVYVPAERVADFYKAIKADVAAGVFDSSIRAAYGDEDVAAPAAKKGGAGKKRGPMSAETKAKISAARKAKSGK